MRSRPTLPQPHRTRPNLSGAWHFGSELAPKAIFTGSHHGFDVWSPVNWPRWGGRATAATTVGLPITKPLRVYGVCPAGGRDDRNAVRSAAYGLPAGCADWQPLPTCGPDAGAISHR
jgi:hypothetical protein